MTPSPHKKPLDSLSIFFPCYNDAGTIGDLIAAALRVAEQISYDYEVLVIDDKSTDNSRAVIEDLLVRYPKLKAVFHEHNRGYGGVLKTGFAAASKEFIFYTDGDGQYSPLELAGIAYKMTEDVHAVNGFKIRRADSWYRLLLGTMYNKFVRFVFGIKMREVDCDFRLIRRSVFNYIKLE
jgi:glycosyltransferase involved in cell wall biosynthesis